MCAIPAAAPEHRCNALSRSRRAQVSLESNVANASSTEKLATHGAATGRETTSSKRFRYGDRLSTESQAMPPAGIRPLRTGKDRLRDNPFIMADMKQRGHCRFEEAEASQRRRAEEERNSGFNMGRDGAATSKAHDDKAEGDSAVNLRDVRARLAHARPNPPTQRKAPERREWAVLKKTGRGEAPEQVLEKTPERAPEQQLPTRAPEQARPQGLATADGAQKPQAGPAMTGVRFGAAAPTEQQKNASTEQQKAISAEQQRTASTRQQMQASSEQQNATSSGQEKKASAEQQKTTLAGQQNNTRAKQQATLSTEQQKEVGLPGQKTASAEQQKKASAEQHSEKRHGRQREREEGGHHNHDQEYTHQREHQHQHQHQHQHSQHHSQHHHQHEQRRDHHIQSSQQQNSSRTFHHEGAGAHAWQRSEEALGKQAQGHKTTTGKGQAGQGVTPASTGAQTGGDDRAAAAAAAATARGGEAVRPQTADAASDEHECVWKERYLVLASEVHELRVAMSDLRASELAWHEAHDVALGRGDEDELGLEGLTIVVHMKGKDDLVINTDLREA
ncbi:hypothetical protein RB597_002346 [Gaeumannomyces tritici]